MVVMTARVEANPGARRELMQALLEWAASARAVGGVKVHLYEDLECAHVFGFVSHWPDLDVLQRHVSGQPFGGLVGAVELLAAASTVTLGSADATPAGIREVRRRTRIGRSSEPRAHES